MVWNEKEMKKSDVIACDAPCYDEKVSRAVDENTMMRKARYLARFVKNGFSILDFKMENFDGRRDFLTTMIFRTDLPDDLSMRIDFFHLDILLYKEIKDGIIAMVYADDKADIYHVIAYRRDGKWKFRYYNPEGFMGLINKMEKVVR